MHTVHCLTCNLGNSSTTFGLHTLSLMSEENGCRTFMVYNQDALVMFYCFKIELSNSKANTMFKCVFEVSPVVFWNFRKSQVNRCPCLHSLCWSKSTPSCIQLCITHRDGTDIGQLTLRKEITIFSEPNSGFTLRS